LIKTLVFVSFASFQDADNGCIDKDNGNGRPEDDNTPSGNDVGPDQHPRGAELDAWFRGVQRWKLA